MIRLSDYIAIYLSKKGIRHIFMLPGGGAMHLNDGIAKSKNIFPVVTLHEQSAGIAAESYGRINKSEIGVVMVTTGPGATNLITPVAGAWIESLPLLVISGQVKTTDMIKRRKIRQGGVQEVPIINLVSKITKFSKTIKDPNLIKYFLDKCFYEALSGRKGPVWLEIPLDIQSKLIDPAKIKGYKIKKRKLNNIKLDKKINTIFELIKTSSKPIIIAGHGVRLSGAINKFRKLISMLQIPFVTTWNSIDLVEFNHELNIGRPGAVALRAPNISIQNCDLIIAIGTRLDNVITGYNPKNFAKYAKKVLVDIDINEIKNQKVKIDYPINLDANVFISELLKRNFIGKHDNNQFKNWISKCTNLKEKYSIEKEKKLSKISRLTHYTFVDKLSEIIPKNTIIATGSSGLSIEVFYTIFKNKYGQRIFLTSGLGSMGYGLPSSIGACIAADKKPTICFEGDGSFQMNIQELATVTSLNLPITIIILNNKGYSSIRNTQTTYFNKRFIGTGPETNLNFPSLEKLANAYKIDYFSIKKIEHLNNLQKNRYFLKKPMIIEVFIKLDEFLEPKISSFIDAKGNIKSMPLEDMKPFLSLKELGKDIEKISKISREFRKKSN